MKTRKIVLLSACFVLFVIAIVQAILNNQDPVKILSVKQEIDEIKIERPDESITLLKTPDGWIANEKYGANESTCESLAATLSSVKILNKVTKSENEEILAKYDLTNDRFYKVSVLKSGNVLRTYYVGKTSSTNSQTYMKIDNDSDVYLVSGTIQNDCSKSLDDYRSKIILALDKDSINSISISDDNGEWTISRGEGWSVVGQPEITVDSEAALSWFQSCANLMAQKWLNDWELPSGEKTISAKITLATKVITIDLYVSKDDEGIETFYGTSSEVPYSFQLAKFSYQKFEKSLEDFEM